MNGASKVQARCKLEKFFEQRSNIEQRSYADPSPEKLYKNVEQMKTRGGALQAIYITHPRLGARALVLMKEKLRTTHSIGDPWSLSRYPSPVANASCCEERTRAPVLVTEIDSTPQNTFQLRRAAMVGTTAHGNVAGLYSSRICAVSGATECKIYSCTTGPLTYNSGYDTRCTTTTAVWRYRYGIYYSLFSGRNV